MDTLKLRNIQVSLFNLIYLYIVSTSTFINVFFCNKGICLLTENARKKYYTILKIYYFISFLVIYFILLNSTLCFNHWACIAADEQFVPVKLMSPVVNASMLILVLYCKTLYICGIKFSRFNDNDVLAYFNFGGHDLPWLQIVKKVIL